jgi:amino-acid N-acetyltransferase
MISALTEDFVRSEEHAAQPLELRKARMADVPALLDLINGYAARGIMLARTEFEISESIRDFSVALAGAELVGCGALHFYSPTTGEIRSLAVRESAKTCGVGRQLVETLVNEAQAYSLHSVFAFTYVVEFFRKAGFMEVECGLLPLKVWKDCVRCPKFQSCDETAVMRVLKAHKWLDATPKWVSQSAAGEGSENILLPIIRKQ